jgi:hypothetical protein
VPKNLMSRPADGRLTALLKLDLEQLKEAVAAPHRRMRSGRRWAQPSLGCQMRPRRLRRVAGAFPRMVLPNQSHVCRANPSFRAMPADLRSTTAAFIAPTPASRLIARSGRWAHEVPRLSRQMRRNVGPIPIQA